MNVTVVLTGVLPAVIIVSAVLTTLVSVFLLRLYRGAVVRAMKAEAGIAAAPEQYAAALNAAGSRALPVLAVIDPASQTETASPGGAAYRKAVKALNNSVIIYLLAGLAYALVLTAAWMIAAKGGFMLPRFLWMFSCYTWPFVLAVYLINPAIMKRIAIFYFLAVLLVAGIALARNPDLTVGQLLYLWVFSNGAGTILLLGFLNRHVRAVGPLVLAFMVAAVTGAFILVQVVGSSEGVMRGVVKVGGMLGLGAVAIFVLLHVAGFVFFGFMGWFLLRRLGRQYQKKRMSDQSITLDALWLLFGVVQSFTLVFEGWVWIFTGLVAFAAYKLAVGAGVYLLVRQHKDESTERTLLLLRVFSLGRRSQRLFERLSRVWLGVGSISLISGPDLVTTTVEPHEFLDFVGGRLSRRFVQGKADLEQRVSLLDTRPDPDGRYRVNEFFCRADTWQMTMQQLASRCDVVLMDLRSFSKNNQGCMYELRHLFNNVNLDRVIILLDETTSRDFLEITVREIWRDLAMSSPNNELSTPTVRCLSVNHLGPEGMDGLLLTIFGSHASA